MHLERVDVDAHAALAALVRLVRVRVRIRVRDRARVRVRVRVRVGVRVRVKGSGSGSGSGSGYLVHGGDRLRGVDARVLRERARHHLERQPELCDGVLVEAGLRLAIPGWGWG